ncbi:MAG: FAD-dependent oxidoreductase, partial [bacterium]
KADKFGITVNEPTINLSKVIDRKNEIVSKLIKGLDFLIQKNGIEIIHGEGIYKEPGFVKVGNRDFRSKAIIVATGSSPISLPGLTFDGQKFLSSDHILECREIPAKLDIVGGGVIGIHFAHIFSTLGTEVTVYEALPDILTGIDEEAVALVKRILKRKNINILTGTKFEAANSGGKTLICIGRRSNSPCFTVNEKMETSLPGVYAVGDVVSKKQLAHVAYEQGEIAAENALGGNRTFSYENIPIGIYTDPEIGSVGLTEQEARLRSSSFGGQAKDIKIGKFPFAALGISAAVGEQEGFVKIISDEKDNLLGVHIIGPEATTLIGIATLALRNKLKVGQLANCFQSHPSFPEAIQEAALGALKRGLHSIVS